MRYITPLLLTIAVFSGASAQTVPSGYFTEIVVSSLSEPTTMAFVSPSTILVCQKATGQVKIITNGVNMGNAIDLGVTSNSERGLLGICLDPNFASNGFVYLYYSRSSTGADSTTSSTWADNRVEKFFWNGSTLTYNSTIIVFPTDAGQSNGPNHDGGIIMIGPDQKLYVMTGDLNRRRTELNTGTGVCGVGGIFRLNLDGTTPLDNPFITHSSPSVQKMYAYGIRNSFGMTFDPITNYIWFTENGPNVYDEVNVIPSPGMNSGWIKIMGPDSRNATYTENGNTAYNAADLTYFPNAYYRDPVFSWLAPVAVTGILFLNTDKVMPGDKGKCLIADNNFSLLHWFTPNLARDGFVLSGAIADTVADSSAERNLSVFGTGWGAATDLKLGPDGYIYVVSYVAGRIVRIRPNVETIAPSSLSMFRGSILSGTLSDTLSSDDAYLVLRPGAVFTNSEAPVQAIFSATSPFFAPSQYQFSVEAQASAPNITQTISLYNFQTSAYDVLDTRTATTSDSVATVTVSAGASNYVDQTTGEVRAKLSGKAQGAVFIYPWTLKVDQVQWTFTR